MLPDGFRLRPATDGDAAAVAALANEESRALVGATIFSTEWLLRSWTAPSIDRERDVAVVEGPEGTVCGYLGIGADPPFSYVSALGIVALPYHGQGLGAALVSETERRACRYLELAAPGRRVALHAETLAEEPRIAELLATRGYRQVRQAWLMRLDFDGEPAAPAPIGGIELRTLRPDTDARPVFEAHLEAFADTWRAREETFESFCHYLLSGDWFDPSLCFVAWAGSDVGGYVLAIDASEEDPRRGYAQLLGVRPTHRRRGIGEALLRQTFRALYARGQAGCDLHADPASETGAIRLYERIGMTPHPRFATWEKELRPGS